MKTQRFWREALIHKRRSFSRTKQILTVSVVLAIMLVGRVLSVSAGQGGNDWTPPMLVYETKEGAIRDIQVVVDGDGILHLFFKNSSQDRNGTSVYHAKWNGKWWTEPVDILMAESISTLQAASDEQRVLHLIWQGELGLLYHSHAAVTEADTAHGWSEPMALDQSNFSGTLLAGDDGRLHIFYPGKDTSGIFHLESPDGGLTWENRTLVALTSSPMDAADSVQAAWGAGDTIHVTWTEYPVPELYPPTGIYYARSDDGGLHWTPPLQIAGPDHIALTVVADGERVHLGWNGTIGNGGRYHTESANGGQTWSRTHQVVAQGLGGAEGYPQLVIDSTGKVHYLTTYGQRVWYSVFVDHSWRSPQYVSSGDERGIPPLGTQIDAQTIRHIEQPALTLTEGYTLHAFFWDARASKGVTYVWHTMRIADAPRIEPSGVPVESTLEPTSTAEVTVEPTSNSLSSTADFARKKNSPTTKHLTALAWSLIPALVLVGGVIITYYFRQR